MLGNQHFLIQNTKYCHISENCQDALNKRKLLFGEQNNKTSKEKNIYGFCD